ncbi:MAG: hypothetical protein FWJ90_23885 [Actinomadura sp.]
MGQERKIRATVTPDNEGVGGILNTLEVWNDNFDEIRRIVDSMQPRPLENGAAEYDRLAKRMHSTATLIYKQGMRMVEAWGGDDAKKAMENLNKTYRQVQEIEKVSRETSKAMAAHAEAQHGWKNAYGSGSPMDSWVKDVVNWGNRILALNPASAPSAIGGLIANNIGAKQVMDAINEGTVKSNDNFPPSIRQDLASPNIRDTEFPEPPGTGRPPGSPKMPGGGGPGDLPGGPGDLPGGPGGPGDLPGGPGGPNTPGGPNGPGIPGGPNGPGIPGGPDGPGGIPGGGPGTDLASMPGGPGAGPGLGAGGVGGGMPGGPGGGPGLGGVGSGPGGLGAGVGPGAGLVGGPGALGRGSMGGRGGMGMGMPMGAGARPGGDGGDEHERKTWLTEDEDVWGGNDDTAPPVIG